MLFIILAFLAALIFTAYWHMNQNRRLFKEWKQKLDGDTALWLNQFAWSRTLQLVVALACGLLASLLLYNGHLQDNNEAINTINSNIQVKLEEIAKAQQQTAQAQTQALQAIQANVQNKPNPPEPNNYPPAAAAQAPVNAAAASIPPISVTAQNIAPADNAGFPDNVAMDIPPPAENNVATGGTTPPADTSPEQTIDDIYNPEEHTSGSQSAMDAIKKRYESLLVNYLFLKKCGMINAQDYHTIISTLSREMASINAPGRLEHDILTSAQGSYNEMYSKSNCKGPEIEGLYKQYTDYIKTISENVPVN